MTDQPIPNEEQRTKNEEQPLPAMSRQEASFHASTAGVRAAKAAEAQGCDPAAAFALGAGATGGKVINGVGLPLPSAYSALSVPAIAALLEKHSQTISGIRNDCLFIAAFAKPKEVYQLAVVQADAEAAKALVDLADELAIALLTRDHIDAAAAWCMDAFHRLNGVKKPSAETAPDPGTNHSTGSSSSDSSPVTVSAPDPAG